MASGKTHQSALPGGSRWLRTQQQLPGKDHVQSVVDHPEVGNIRNQEKPHDVANLRGSIVAWSFLDADFSGGGLLIPESRVSFPRDQVPANVRLDWRR